MAQKLPLKEFAASIKNKYPEYKDVDDSVLVARMIEKYPTYADRVDLGGEKKNPIQSSPVGANISQTSGQPSSNSDEQFLASNARYAQDAENRLSQLESQKNFPINLGLDARPQQASNFLTGSRGDTTPYDLSSRPNWVGATERAQSEKLVSQLQSWQEANPNSQPIIRTLEELDGLGGEIKQVVPESWGKRNKERGQYIYNSLLGGVGSLVNATVDFGLQVKALTDPMSQGVASDLALTNYRLNMSDDVRGFLTDIIGADMDDRTVERYKNELITGGIGGLAATAPALIGSKLRTGRLFLQAFDGALQSIEQTDTNNELSNLDKTIYSSLVGGAVAMLEKAGFDKIFKANTQKVASYVANKALQEAGAAGGNVTGDMLEKAVKNNLSELSNRVINGGSKVVESFITEALTGAAQEVATIGSEAAFNTIKGKEFFDVSDPTKWEGWLGENGFVGRVLEAGALEGVGGGFLGGISAITSSSTRKSVMEKSKAINALDAQINSGELQGQDLDAAVRLKTSYIKAIESELQESYETFQRATEEEMAKIREVNNQIVSNEQLVESPSTSDAIKEAAKSKIDELDSQLDEIVTTVEARKTNSPEIIDNKVVAYRENNPNIPVPNIMDGIPESVVTTVERLDDNTPIDPIAAKEASDALYSKYNELKESKTDVNRQHTVEEIDAAMTQLEADITALENYTTEGVQVEGIVQPEPAKQAVEVVEQVEETPVATEVQDINRKEQQLEIINRENPAPNNQLLWVRSVDDILTAEEAFAGIEEDGGAMFPDFTEEQMQESLDSGYVMVYSSHPIKEGVFVTPSKMNAESYSGDRKVYSKKVSIDDVAWLDQGEGQYAPIKQSRAVDSVAETIKEEPAKTKEQTPDILSSKTEAPVVEEVVTEEAVVEPVQEVEETTAESETEAEVVEVDEGPPSFSSPDEYYRYVAETSNNPDEIAVAYHTVPQGEADYVEQGIMDYLGNSKINRKDYNRYGDRNALGRANSVRWIDKNNKSIPLDRMAMELSDMLGVEVTEQDFIDFVNNYTGLKDFKESAKSDSQKALEQKYYELTGRNLTPRVAEATVNRIDRNMTDAERLEFSEAFTELGITYQDVLNYENFIQETTRENATSVPKSENESDRSTKKTARNTESQSENRKPKIGKRILKSISDRLAKTGLANGVKITNNKGVGGILSGQGLSIEGENVYGFIDPEGNIVINEDTAGLDTPIHEFAHIWERVVEKDNPELHARGMELIQTDQGKPYVEYVKEKQPHLQGVELYREALVQAIGDRGARLIEKTKQSDLKKWLSDAWKYIGNMVGISGMTPKQIGNLTLNQYADAVAVDLLSGKPYKRLNNGDVIAETTATSKSDMDAAEKFMADFMVKMKQRNGINFQGEIDGDIPADIFQDLVKFFRYGIKKGQFSTMQEARDMGKTMGFKNVSDVEMAFKLARMEPKGVVGFKKDQVPVEVVMASKNVNLSDTQWRQLGVDMVNSGLIDPEKLVADIIVEPRAIQPYELAALQYYQSQIEKSMDDVTRLVDEGSEADVMAFTYRVGTELLTGYQAMAVKAEVLNAAKFDLEMAILATNNPSSAAFRMRQMMHDKDFSIVSYLTGLKAIGRVPAELEAKLKKMAQELDKVRSKLRIEMEKVEALSDQIAQGNITESARTSKPTQRKVKPRKDTVDAVNLVLDALDVTSFGNAEFKFQAGGTIRFQASFSDAVSRAVSEAVVKMKQDVADGTMSVADAIESAIDSVNQAVGEGSWNAIKFRSTVTNMLVQQSIPVKAKKPYVTGTGSLVIPGAYIKDLARNGFDTIDAMVSETSKELGGRYSESYIRNTIVGYGRRSGEHRSDLDRKIAKAKRVGLLLSKIQDLKDRGQYLKTRDKVTERDAEIDKLAAELKRLEYEMEMTPEEREQLADLKRDEQTQKYIRNYIAQLEERIANKDFAPVKHQNKLNESDEVKRLRVEAEKIKHEFNKEKYRHELRNRTASEKIRSIVYKVVFDITRGLMAGADLSAMGVQGLVFAAANPRMAGRIFKESIKPTFSSKEYENFIAEMKADPFYPIAEKAGLHLQLQNYYVEVQEEQTKGSFQTALFDIMFDAAGKLGGKKGKKAADFAKDKLNPFKIGDRNYSVVLSKVRMELFKEFMTNQINKNGINAEVDQDVVERVADMVNVLTMASKIPVVQGKLQNDILSAVFFSARKLVATWRVLGGMAFAWAPMTLGVGGTKNKQLWQDMYVKNVYKGLGTLFMMSALPTAIAAIQKGLQDDDEEEDPYFYNPNFLNPIHSDFLKLKMGDTRVSLFQGIDGNFVLLSRIANWGYMTTTSKEFKKLGEGNNKTAGQLGIDYLSNKLAPTPGIIVKYLGTERDVVEGQERLNEAIYPMWMSGINEQFENTGSIGETTLLGALGVFGLSYNNYGGAEFARGGDPKAKEVSNLMNKSGLVAYNPRPFSRKAWDGESHSKLGGEKFDKEYLPAYESFMTEAVLSNKADLMPSKHWEHKEGRVNELKREAYKYAELKTSGVIMDANFTKISEGGVQYRLTKSQVPIKLAYIKEFEDEYRSSEFNLIKNDIKISAEVDGKKYTDEYIDMLAEIAFYNQAKRYANEKILDDNYYGKISLIMSTEYTKDMDEE